MQNDVSHISALKQAVFDSTAMNDLGLKKQDLDLSLKLAKDAYEQGDFATTLRYCSLISFCAPKEPSYQILLAQAALAVQEFELALGVASNLIILSPKNPLSYLLSAQACLGMGHIAEAKEDLSDAMSFSKMNHDGHTFMESKKLLEQI